MANYVFFDFDGTLTHRDSLMPFLRFVAGDKKYVINLFILSPIFIAYFLKLIKNDRAKEIVLRRFLSGIEITTLQEKAVQFATIKLPQLLREEGIKKLRLHQEKGDKCILVSASLEIYLQPWAKSFGFSNVIGTQLEILEINDQKYTGKIDGKNCYGQEKINRIERLYDLNCWQNSFAYSDSLADRPLLEKAAHGFLLKKHVFTAFH